MTSIGNGPDGWRLRIDYVQFLTGPEAEKAAVARGQEPLDFFVINDNPKIREFPVRSGSGVTVVTNADGSSDPGGHALSLAEWAGAMTGPQAQVFGATLYWVTITDGVVTTIDAQYLP